jgi:hypothetical protein
LLILPQILSYLISGIFGCGFAIEAKAPYPGRKRRGDNVDERSRFRARVFQAWADGRIEGTAEDVFETVQQVLET